MGEVLLNRVLTGILAMSNPPGAPQGYEGVAGVQYCALDAIGSSDDFIHKKDACPPRTRSWTLDAKLCGGPINSYHSLSIIYLT